MDDSKIRNMEQFARVSGISRPTVSKYFNDPSSVRPKTRARIEEALEQYDYRPNIFAVNQNRRLTKNIGIVVPYLADPFFAEIARNIEQRCMQAGFWPTLFSAHGDSALEVEILDSLRSLKPAGVLLAPWAAHRTAPLSRSFATMCPPYCSTATSRAWAKRLSGQTTRSSSNSASNTCAAPESRPVFLKCPQ